MLADWEKGPRQYIKTSSDQKLKKLLALSASGESVQILYRKYDGSVENRRIKPKRIFKQTQVGKIYLEAFCERRGAIRIFNVDQLSIASSGKPKSKAPSKGGSVMSSGNGVYCSVDYVTLENDDGRNVDGVEVTCSRCGHVTESYGDGDDSIKRCLALMREECPNNETNWYMEE